MLYKKNTSKLLAILLIITLLNSSSIYTINGRDQYQGKFIEPKPGRVEKTIKFVLNHWMPLTITFFGFLGFNGWLYKGIIIKSGNKICKKSTEYLKIQEENKDIIGKKISTISQEDLEKISKINSASTNYFEKNIEKINETFSVIAQTQTPLHLNKPNFAQKLFSNARAIQNYIDTKPK